MKLTHVILVVLPLVVHTYPYPESKVTELTDVNVSNDEEATDRDGHVQKRSGGSGDYLVHLKAGLLSSLGQASASIASSSSAGSSGGGGYKSYGHDSSPHHYDPWSLKKSVLSTIFQALKAITGGVTALKGQLIKGSGYALSASGHVVAASGDKISDVGKVIISSASNKNQLPHSGGGGQHPFAKFSSLSGASSSGGGGKPGGHDDHIVHTETITAYEIPSSHSSYGPSKPVTYSSSSHNYLPPAGGAGFSHGGHVAFEAPYHNYLPTSYIYDEHDDDFNIYGHKELTDEDKTKGASQLEEILSQLPIGKTEYTASKTVTYSGGSTGTSISSSDAFKEYNKEHDNVRYYIADYKNDHHNPETLNSVSHTNSITAAYKPQSTDLIHFEKDKLNPTPEEIYIAKHPDEGYKYSESSTPITTNIYHLDHADITNTKQVKTKTALNDLKSILLALEADKHYSTSAGSSDTIKDHFYNYKRGSSYNPTNFAAAQALSKTKYIPYPPISPKYEYHNKFKTPTYSYANKSYKQRRHTVPCLRCIQQKRDIERRADTIDIQHYYHMYDDNQNSVLYSPPLMGGGEFY